ncbi:NUDIX hydrolase [Bacillus ginsengihumi]|uniref:NUDIX hydrolase n=1 Tax=Heyndrickxia ginsengihumi TaxID=363870 RepID=A0A6M0PCI1_9BACI|nr:NUDIX hydrolase [Heyndrickxia ginsengihumi]NEY21338.1 NUDIX hydrolase [Heyndrickxia ginsengihumi]
MEPKWLYWAKKLQAISQAGLAYAKDVNDLERLELIRNISVEMLSQQTNVEMSVIKDLFAGETGYATPKVDIRAVIFKDEKILMVKEKSDGNWSLPGGWADIGLTPSEVAVKEVKEESGLEVASSKLLAVFDKKCHAHPYSPYAVYKLFIQCELIGGQPQAGIETDAVQFFSKDALPLLSITRNTITQIEIAFKHLQNPLEPVDFD